MNELTPSYKFAVILFPADGNRWFANIICNDGPIALNAALPYADAYEHAQDALEKMLHSIVSTHVVQVWTLHITREVADNISSLDRDTLFAEIEKLPLSPLTGVQHEIVEL